MHLQSELVLTTLRQCLSFSVCILRRFAKFSALQMGQSEPHGGPAGNGRDCSVVLSSTRSQNKWVFIFFFDPVRLQFAIGNDAGKRYESKRSKDPGGDRGRGDCIFLLHRLVDSKRTHGDNLTWLINSWTSANLAIVIFLNNNNFSYSLIR